MRDRSVAVHILFDRNVPAPLRRFLIGHKVEGTEKFGWSQLKNGELLKAAEAAGFDVLITADQNIAYQQNLAHRSIALVVLGSNPWKIVRDYANQVVMAVNAAQLGSYAFIEMPRPPKLPRTLR